MQLDEAGAGGQQPAPLRVDEGNRPYVRGGFDGGVRCPRASAIRGPEREAVVADQRENAASRVEKAHVDAALIGFAGQLASQDQTCVGRVETGETARIER